MLPKNTSKDTIQSVGSGAAAVIAANPCRGELIVIARQTDNIISPASLRPGVRLQHPWQADSINLSN